MKSLFDAAEMANDHLYFSSQTRLVITLTLAELVKTDSGNVSPEEISKKISERHAELLKWMREDSSDGLSVSYKILAMFYLFKQLMCEATKTMVINFLPKS